VDTECSWIIENLAGVTNVSRHARVIDGLVKADKYTSIRSLAAELGSNENGSRWAVEWVFDHLERTLALHPALDAAKTLLHIAGIARVRSVQSPQDPMRRAQRLAAFLASAQNFQVLEEIVDDASLHGAQEVMACWVQEYVIRGGSIPAESNVSRFWSELAERSHPLARLPLELLQSECSLVGYVPTYSATRAACAIPFGPAEDSTRVTADTERDVVIEGDLTVPDGLTRPFVAWLRESNGAVDARAWAIKEGASTVANPSELLCRLDFPALSGAGVENVHTRRAAFPEALAVLFAGASGGGAYGGAVQAAYARHYAWQSVAAFLRRKTSDLRELDALALDSAWFLFHADSDWFRQVAWDVGVACIASDRRSLTLLAATDTD
jgi:hypothetical protein